MIIQGTALEFFNEEEFEDVYAMHLPLLVELNELRRFLGRAIGVHESNPKWFPGTKHKKGSLHYKGQATDCYCKPVTLWEFFLAATRFRFTGIGVYPYWNTPGLHLEIDTLPFHPRKYWWRDEAGNYRAMSIYDLNKVFTIPAVSGI